MNCQAFETIIVELAREQLVEASDRELTLVHLTNCSCCAARFANEQALTAGLRRFAATLQNLEAQPRVESVLREAYRERLRLSALQVKAPSLVSARRWPRWTAVAAALILILLALIALRGGRKSVSEQAQNGSENIQPIPQSPQNTAKEKDVSGLADQTVSRTNTHIRRRKQDLKPYKAKYEEREYLSNSNEKVEIATDFIPVTGNNLIPLEGGSVVRVELPRSALMSFGLPMNVERSDERIKADVVIGNDGVARAIRFVR